MTQDITTAGQPDTKDSAPVSVCLLPSDIFITLIGNIKEGLSPCNDDFYYQFKFVEGKNLIGIAACNEGNPIYSKDELDDIKSRYENMGTLITNMSTIGFKIEAVMFQNNGGFHNVSFTYFDMKNRKQELRYSRDSRPAQLITDDFLYDLRHIPLRNY